MLQWALKYSKLGFSVIPIEPRGKKPLIKWEEFQTRKASEDEVKAWFAKWPNANVGIVTGAISGLAVIDLDGSKGLLNAQRFGLTSTITCLTGTGKHLYYKWTDGIKNSASTIAEKIDVRGEGGYVVAPPSIHPNGRRYHFLAPFVSYAVLPQFPKQLFTMAQENITAEKVTVGKESDWISDALEEIKNGHTANTLVSILGKFRAHNFSELATFNFLSPYTQKGGMSDDVFRAKLSEIWGRYEPNETQTSVGRIGELRPGDRLVIHSPSSPESWKHFSEQTDLGRTDRTALKSGYSKLDSMLKGGLKSSRLFTVAARTGVGKTNFLIACARALCDQGKRVLLFSTEMPYAQIWERYLAILKDERQFRGHAFYICDSFAPNLERVEEAIKEVQPHVFMFDHINHVSEDQKELGNFMQGLNFLRRKYDTAGIISAQLNRQADWVDIKTGEKIVPRMSMIKGSGTIEQASSRVLLLSETRVSPEGTEIVGNLDKNDCGPKGLMHFMLKNNPYKMIEV